MPFTDTELLAVLHDAATAVREALAGLGDWGLAGTRDGQYRHDLVADRAAVEVLSAAGLAVMSEESGGHPQTDGGVTVVLDPVDGSTNASRGIPWFNTSLCAVDADGLRAAVIVDQTRGVRYEATRGGGARCDGRPIAPAVCTTLGEALVGLNGYPARHLGWKQYRALGAAALDLCAVAAGILDGYLDCTRHGMAPWDYLGGVLVCQEAGAVVGTLSGAAPIGFGHDERHVMAAAASPELLAELLEARRTFA
ncbi:MAG: inositol monophosphatase family protein [Acidimicrobiales bacterium]